MKNNRIKPIQKNQRMHSNMKRKIITVYSLKEYCFYQFVINSPKLLCKLNGLDMFNIVDIFIFSLHRGVLEFRGISMESNLW